MNLLERLALALMLALSMQACNTTARSVETAQTLQTSQRLCDHYDSIYVLHDRQLNTLHDTVWATERITEYRYRYVHDTLLVTRTDTLIQKDTLQMKESHVVNTPPHKVPRSKWSLTRGGWERVCTWLDLLAYSSLAILVLLLLYRIRSTANLLKR